MRSFASSIVVLGGGHDDGKVNGSAQFSRLWGTLCWETEVNE